MQGEITQGGIVQSEVRGIEAPPVVGMSLGGVTPAGSGGERVGKPGSFVACGAAGVDVTSGVFSGSVPDWE
ncbi:MAG: hypothetical protein WBW31_23070 [Candidatus Sulfotelmatobacter sp.]